MEDNKYSISILFSILVILISTIIYNNSMLLTKRLYVINVYLYILLAIIITCITTIFVDYFGFNLIDTISIITIFIFALIIIFLMAYTDRSNIVLRHLLWLIFAILIGILIYPAYTIADKKNILISTIISIIIMIIMLSFIVMLLPEKYLSNWGSILLYSLLGLIIVQVIDYSISWFNNSELSKNRFKLYSMIGVVLFSGFIMYDTQNLFESADEVIYCVKNQLSTNQLACADYPNKSLNLFLDIVNLFTSMIGSHN